MTETKERLVSKIKIKCHFGTLSSKKKDHGSTKRYETMKLHQMLPTLNKYTENSEMPPEKKKNASACAWRCYRISLFPYLYNTRYNYTLPHVGNISISLIS